VERKHGVPGELLEPRQQGRVPRQVQQVERLPHELPRDGQAGLLRPRPDQREGHHGGRYDPSGEPGFIELTSTAPSLPGSTCDGDCGQRPDRIQDRHVDSRLPCCASQRIPPRPGVSEPWRYEWFVDGVQQTPTNIVVGCCKARPRPRTSSGPRTFSFRALHVQYDWVRIWTPKVDISLRSPHCSPSGWRFGGRRH
jgi:hypothetical protein